MNDSIRPGEVVNVQNKADRTAASAPSGGLDSKQGGEIDAVDRNAAALLVSVVSAAFVPLFCATRSFRCAV